MKYKNISKNPDFKQIRNKIFFQTILLLIIVFTILFLSFSLLVNGRFGNFMVAILEDIFRLDRTTAKTVYQHVFRNNRNLFIIIAIVSVSFIVFRIYLNWFTKYFIEINKGIDSLVREDTTKVTLSAELAATENKINYIRSTLDKQKEEARLAEQRKNDLIVYLAHDLKTPLTSIIGYLTLLRDKGEASEELRDKYINITLDKSERLEELINEFFEITKFNHSSMVLDYSEVNLTRMLEQLTYEFRPALEEKKIKYNLRAEPNIMLSCDPNRLQRVFDNLLRNAVYYSYPETTVEINAALEGSDVKITFINHGDTIPTEEIGKIFEQFYRTDTSRSSDNGGSGLGLAIAKSIVELHKGRIEAHSENNTITFEVLLPSVGNS